METAMLLYRTLKDQTEYFAAYDASMRLWSVPYTSRFVDTLYGKAHVLVCGPENGFPVVLLHGGYASSTMWYANVAALSAKYRVYAMDTLGEPGKSVPTQVNASCQACADWLACVMDRLDIPKAHVIGLSRGGWLALNLALHAPGRLEKVVLLSPAASFVTLSPFFQALSKVVIRLRVKTILRAVLYAWVAPGNVVNAVFERQFILGLLHWNWAVNVHGYSGVMPSVFRAEELGSLHNPVLMLIGDHDRLNPPAVIARARQMIPHLEGAVISNAGHMLSMEQPDCVDAYIMDFL